MKTRVVKEAFMKFRYPNFQKNQWLSQQEIFDLQSRLLRKMIEEAYSNVLFWKNQMKEKCIRPADIKTAQDLAKLPLTDKELMRGKEEFISKKIESLSPEIYHTGGSTGRTFSYYTTSASRLAIRACKIRGWHWAGYKYGDRIVSFTGGGLTGSHLTLDCVGMNEKIMDDYIKRINKSNIDIYRGIPSALMTFARHVEKRGINMKKKCVLTTSENLLLAHRKYINEILGEVFDGYGANDGGSSAYECPEHNGWHISADKCIFEVIKDGEVCTPGEEGIITVTDLFNYGMPWIRYQSNDLAVLSDEKCSCGRGLPLMAKLLGRTTDLIQTKNTIINGTELANNIICKTLPIIAFQFVQKATDRLEVRIVKDFGWLEKHEKIILDTLHSYDADLRIKIEYASEIAKTPAGKSMYVVSEIGSDSE